MTGVYKENLRSFDRTMEECSDIVLSIHNAKFFVSKLYLATHSPYFKVLFLGKFNEANKTEIKLSGIDSDDFQNYLEVLYGEQAINEQGQDVQFYEARRLPGCTSKFWTLNQHVDYVKLHEDRLLAHKMTTATLLFRMQRKFPV
ncbi:hypothetical protein GCK72_022961 [Caenorhabditis remanei]|uniref:BTB domain-containing protein n=1 Tax=Caenorhabditis remanei TaxID=31234 RepID=A0A6A5FVG5_CAERE|nr:hypothetical protein GCK72_022961 [Caenorhabditis remanei]KAF1746505.1 hypothetical protein GCK72_022961 [Caenorhabditis remanei]